MEVTNGKTEVATMKFGRASNDADDGVDSSLFIVRENFRRAALEHEVVICCHEGFCVLCCGCEGFNDVAHDRIINIIDIDTKLGHDWIGEIERIT